MLCNDLSSERLRRRARAHACSAFLLYDFPLLKSITGGVRSCKSALAGQRERPEEEAEDERERGSIVRSYICITDLHDVPPPPSFSCPIHTCQFLFLSRLVSSPASSPLPPGGRGSADSHILGRSRAFLFMSKSPAGLWPPPDGRG